MKSSNNHALLRCLFIAFLVFAVGLSLGYHLITPTPITKDYLTQNDDTVSHGVPGYIAVLRQAWENTASASETVSTGDDDVYFAFLNGPSVVIPDRSARGFSMLAGLFAMIWFVLLLYRKVSKAKDLLVTLGLLLLSLLLAAVIGVGGTAIYDSVRSSGKLSELSGILHGIYFMIALAVILITFLISYFAVKRANNRQTMLIGGMILYCAFNGIFLFFYNSITYLFTIPMLVLLAFSVLSRHNNRFNASEKLRIVYGVISGVVTLMIYTPVIDLLYSSLLSKMLYLNTLLIAFAAMPIGILFASAFLHKEDEVRAEDEDEDEREHAAEAEERIFTDLAGAAGPMNDIETVGNMSGNLGSNPILRQIDDDE